MVVTYGNLDSAGPSPYTFYRDNTLAASPYFAALEQSIHEQAIRGVTLTFDRATRMQVFGRRNNLAPGSIDITYRVKYGATTMWQDTLTEAPGGGGLFIADLYLISGAPDGSGQFLYGTITYGTDDDGEVGEGTFAVIPPTIAIRGSAAEDATIEQVFALTFECDADDFDSYWVKEYVIMELK